jgi:ring-1,2-phenylacetyl-CoA epoxidase subunit PaaD
MIKADEIYNLISLIPDPEIPVINIVELGVLRKVEVTDDAVIIYITPTYSGCPAMKQMEDDIIKLLNEKGFNNIVVKTIYQPPWTTDWITDDAKRKLFEYGIAPPEKASQDKTLLYSSGKKIKCPRCKSLNTELVSQFGSTACKALYRCKDCLEPFDYFKCL